MVEKVPKTNKCPLYSTKRLIKNHYKQEDTP